MRRSRVEMFTDVGKDIVVVVGAYTGRGGGGGCGGGGGGGDETVSRDGGLKREVRWWMRCQVKPRRGECFSCR